jgi:Domain of unknown function (DUF4145)
VTKYVSPSTDETAFSCPHCGAYTTQHWYSLLAQANDKESPAPNLPNAERRDYFAKSTEVPDSVREKLLEWCDKAASGNTFFEDAGEYKSSRRSVQNLNISECYNCGKQAVWVHTALLHPFARLGPSPNSDLPADIQADFEEARAVVNVSPRGAAALLRLCVQKLCAHLGESGKNIDADIASLVKKGLNPVIQQSLDIVRVVGNEAVHPGTLDLRDDQASAIQLLQLLNAICEQMITHPKSVQEMYGKLPEAKRKAIEARDSKPT